MWGRVVQVSGELLTPPGAGGDDGAGRCIHPPADTSSVQLRSLGPAFDSLRARSPGNALIDASGGQ